MSKRNPEVDVFLAKSDRWRSELVLLRDIVLGCELFLEEIRWGKPAYTFGGNNVALLYRFKHFGALGFLKGALLDDAESMLVAPGANSQAMRRLQFTSTDEIVSKQTIIETYLHRAVEVEKAGLEIDFKAKRELECPRELLERFDSDCELEQAFRALSPGKQRGYVLHFNGAKQSQTRRDRIDKYRDSILAGRGINDR